MKGRRGWGGEEQGEGGGRAGGGEEQDGRGGGGSVQGLVYILCPAGWHNVVKKETYIMV